ncbi:hypothetical protein B0T19DRAFT_482542 [Cercophora scortea]|uniref:Ankyrin repeat protein n=1 Tax=Cercophora scortea TaxID=314031 RepID=A0AAE0MH21_9PEZI|nr:hypothetical protein B0T19DRAFT_482542 [Cercophora scortea]
MTPTGSCHVVVVHDKDQDNIQWLSELEGHLKTNSILADLPINTKVIPQCHGLELSAILGKGQVLNHCQLSIQAEILIQGLETNLGIKSDPTSHQHGTTPASNSSEDGGRGGVSQQPEPLVVLVGLGFGALVAMRMALARDWRKKPTTIVPMGVILSSGSLHSQAREFLQRWSFVNSAEPEKPGEDWKFVKDFNHLCHRQRYIPCARSYNLGEIRRIADCAIDPRTRLIATHINRSWPEALLHLARRELSDVDGQAAMHKLIDQHLGELYHEPTIAKVLHEAAARNNECIIEKLLKDRVHPDVRVTGEDSTALSQVGSHYGGEQGENPSSARVKELLYQYGAKRYSSPAPWTLWGSIGAEDNADDNAEAKGKEGGIDGDNVNTGRSTRSSEGGGIGDGNKGAGHGRAEGREGGNGTEEPEFRALIVEMYSRKTRHDRDVAGRAPEKEPRNGDRIPASHEFHRIAHPTVEELVYTKGPNKIMGSSKPKLPEGSSIDDSEYQRIRWIHLPMNHDLVEKVCNENCADPHKHEGHGPGSIQLCDDQCGTSGNKPEFPCMPGCKESLFDPGYWLGHQNTMSTEEHSHIRYLRPQFHRLTVKNKRTGFVLALPYVHFDTYDSVVRLKKKAAKLKKAKTCLLDPASPIVLLNADKTWEYDKDGSVSHDSYTDETPCLQEDSNRKVPLTTIGVVQKSLYSHLPLHYRRTLSQFYFDSKLQKQRQVITDYFERKWPDRDALTLMVDQIWMLVLADGTIITCFPSQMHGLQRIFPYIYTDIVEGLLMSLRGETRAPIFGVLDLGFLIIQECIGFLFNQRVRYNDCFRFLTIYEQQLSEVAAYEADWFEQLSVILGKLPDPKELAKYEEKARECLGDLLRLDRKNDLIEKMNKLKHIRRELNVLLEVVTIQIKVIKQMTDEMEGDEVAWNGFTSGEDLKTRRQRRAEKLEARKRTIEDVDSKAKHIMENLELFITRREQKVDSLQSYFSSRLSERSTRMEVVVFVFTFVTTVFAPLSFLAAFMALQITEYPHDGGNVSLPLSFASTFVFGVGMATVACIMIPAAVAFGIPRMIKWSWLLRKLKLLPPAANSSTDGDEGSSPSEDREKWLRALLECLRRPNHTQPDTEKGGSHAPNGLTKCGTKDQNGGPLGTSSHHSGSNGCLPKS